MYGNTALGLIFDRWIHHDPTQPRRWGYDDQAPVLDHLIALTELFLPGDEDYAGSALRYADDAAVKWAAHQALSPCGLDHPAPPLDADGPTLALLEGAIEQARNAHCVQLEDAWGDIPSGHLVVAVIATEGGFTAFLPEPTGMVVHLPNWDLLVAALNDLVTAWYTSSMEWFHMMITDESCTASDCGHSHLSHVPLMVDLPVGPWPEGDEVIGGCREEGCGCARFTPPGSVDG